MQKKAAALGADRLRVHRRGRYAAAFRVRVDRRQSAHRGVLCRQRVHLGAHEAAVRAVLSLHHGAIHRFCRAAADFFAAKAASILLGLLAIPVLFYSLGGMFGKTPDWVNIAIFFLADAALYELRLLTRGALRGARGSSPAFLLLWALAFAFVFFTYRPIHLPLWQDPTNGSTGSPRQGPRITLIIWCSKEGSGCPPCHCSVLPFSSASPAAPRR